MYLYNVHTANIAGGLKNRIFYTVHRGLTNYIDTKAKCRHLKKLTWRDFAAGFNQSFRLEIPSVMLVLSTQLCELLPLSLLSGSTLPPPPVPFSNDSIYKLCEAERD